MMHDAWRQVLLTALQTPLRKAVALLQACQPKVEALLDTHRPKVKAFLETHLPEVKASLQGRLSGSMAFSIALHIFVLFGIALNLPDEYRQKIFNQPLQVLLVNSRSADKPEHADALAQYDLEGSGNVKEKRQAKSPLPAIQNDQQFAQEMHAKRLAQLEQEYKQLLAQIKSDYAVARQKIRNEQSDVTGQGEDSTNQTREIERLEALIHKDWDTYQKLPRRAHYPSASTRGVVYARYVEQWRTKVERIGNKHYPEEARRKKIYGKLQLTVTILPDGSVDTIEVNRSSGHRILDAAAMRIVKLAGPYPPLPPEIVRQYRDGMTITRTWTFTTSNLTTGE